jgi:hypothetical protein
VLERHPQSGLQSQAAEVEMKSRKLGRLAIQNVLLILVILLTGCSGRSDQSDSALIGTWQWEFSPLTIEFKPDGVFEVIGLDGGARGTFEMVDADTVTVNVNGSSTTSDFVISGDTLTMTEDGYTEVYYRYP